MDFTIDADQRALQSAARELAARHPRGQQGTEAPVGPGSFDAATWQALSDLGALALPFTEEQGGVGASMVEVSLVAAELGRANLLTPYAEALLAASVLASTLKSSNEDASSDEKVSSNENASSDDEQLAELLEALLAGEVLVLPALTEPGRAWNTQPTVKADRAGDEWALTGTKAPVPYAEAADRLLVPAHTADGLGLFLVEAASLGEDGIVDLSNTPGTALLIGEAAEQALRRAINLATTTVVGEALGAMQQALDLTVEYLKTRKQFGVPLMTFQTLTQRAADMYVSLELARSAALYASMLASEDPDDTDGISRAKVVLSRTGRHISQEAIQLHGGIGVTAEYSVGHLASRLTDIGHTFGDQRQHLAQLAPKVGGYDYVDILE